MTPERVAYHRLMLLAGLREEYERELDHVLETADPIPEPELTLAFYMSDLNETLSVLYNYTLDHPADDQQVYGMVLSSMRELYARGDFSASRITGMLCTIALAADRRCADPPWCDVYNLSIDQELFEDGHISEAVFLTVFETLLFHGKLLNSWQLSLEQHKKQKKPRLFRKSGDQT